MLTSKGALQRGMARQRRWQGLSCSLPWTQQLGTSLDRSSTLTEAWSCRAHPLRGQSPQEQDLHHCTHSEARQVVYRIHSHRERAQHEACVLCLSIKCEAPAEP